jgi:hypothetical protein
VLYTPSLARLHLLQLLLLSGYHQSTKELPTKKSAILGMQLRPTMRSCHEAYSRSLYKFPPRIVSTSFGIQIFGSLYICETAFPRSNFRPFLTPRRTWAPDFGFGDGIWRPPYWRRVANSVLQAQPKLTYFHLGIGNSRP